MSFEFIEVDPKSVESGTLEEKDDSFVYGHLKRYLSKFTPLPAITVKARSKKLVLVRGQKYLQIAQELDRDRIRAVVLGITFDELRNQGIKGLLRAVPKAELEAEQNMTIATGWHIFFFKVRPQPKLASEIECRFRSFLEQTLPPLVGGNSKDKIISHFDFSGLCLELKFPTPVENEQWANAYHRLACDISDDLLPIDTYQGSRFQM